MQEQAQERGAGAGALPPGAARASVLNAADHRVDADGGAFLDQDLGKDAGAGRRNLGIDLIGGDLEERFVALHVFAGFLEPFGQGSFDNAFAHLGHYDVGHSLFSISS